MQQEPLNTRRINSWATFLCRSILIRPSEYPLSAQAPFHTNSHRPNSPIIITVADRANHTRGFSEPHAFASALADSFPNVVVRLFDTNHPENTYETFIHVMHRTQVMVASHGALESNLIYMREGSLFVEIRGVANGAEFSDHGPNYFNLATDFLVHHRHVFVKDFTSKEQMKYNVSDGEVQTIASIIADYLANASLRPSQEELDLALV